jgi:hypothetical protein
MHRAWFPLIACGLASAAACAALLDAASVTYVAVDAATDADGPSSDTGVGDALGDAGAACIDFDANPLCEDGGFAVNLENSPNHCGRCGHDCQGGGCSGGLCGPTRLYLEPPIDGGPPSGGALVIGVHGGYVYWSTPTDLVSTVALRRIRTDGTMASHDTVVAGLTGFVTALVDDTGVHYVANGVLTRTAHDGSASTPLGNVTLGGALTLGSSPPTLYTTDQGKMVTRVDEIDGGMSTLSADESVPGPIAADGAWVGWLNVPYLREVDGGSSLERLRGGTRLQPIALGAPSFLLFDSTYFYWFELTTNALTRFRTNDPAARPESIGAFGTPSAEPRKTFMHGIVRAGDGVIAGVPDPDTSTHMTLVAFSACRAPRALFHETGVTYSGIASDDKAVYWGVYGGILRRMIK